MHEVSRWRPSDWQNEWSWKGAGRGISTSWVGWQARGSGNLIDPIVVTCHHNTFAPSTMFTRLWKPIAATTVVIGTPTYLYYRYNKSQTFNLPVKIRGADGAPIMTSKTFPLLSLSAVDDRLNANAKSDTITRPGGITWKYNIASVPANEPLEDAHAEAIIAREPSDPNGPGDWLFFAVMDGHSGPHTSRLLSNTLINAVVLQLSLLIHGSSGPTSSKLGIQNPQTISSAIQSAFTKFDEELINAPLKVLANNLDKESLKKKIIPDLSDHPLALPMMFPAISGMLTRGFPQVRGVQVHFR